MIRPEKKIHGYLIQQEEKKTPLSYRGETTFKFSRKLVFLFFVLFFVLWYLSHSTSLLANTLMAETLNNQIYHVKRTQSTVLTDCWFESHLKVMKAIFSSLCIFVFDEAVLRQVLSDKISCTLSNLIVTHTTIIALNMLNATNRQVL